MVDFNAQGLANLACTFVKAGQSAASLFGALARAAQRRVCNFNPQGLLNIAWAFASVCQSNPSLSMALIRAAEQCTSDFHEHNLHMAMWALSRRECLKGACTVFDHVDCAGISFSPLCFEALLMECEERGLLEHEVAIVKGLECLAGKYGSATGFTAFAKHMAAMRLMANKMQSTDSQWRTDASREACNVTFVCIWCACCGPGPLMLDVQS